MLLPLPSTRSMLQRLRIVCPPAIRRAFFEDQDEFCHIVRSDHPEIQQKVPLDLELEIEVSPVGRRDIGISEEKKGECGPGEGAVERIIHYVKVYEVVGIRGYWVIPAPSPLDCDVFVEREESLTDLEE